MEAAVLIFICCALLCVLVLVTLYGYLVHNRNVRRDWKRKWLEDLENLDESEDYKRGFRRALEMTDSLD